MKVNRLRFIIFICLLSCLTACQRPLTTEMGLNQLRALNLEETISRRDEVMLAYSLTAFDRNNQMVGVVNNAWGVQSMKKGVTYPLTSQPPIAIQMPKNGKVVASLVLLEVDNFSQAQTLVQQIQKLNRWVQVPVGFLALGIEALTPLKYLTLGLTAAGLGVQFTDRLDDDDVLGQSSVEWKEVDFRKKAPTQHRIPARFTGKNFRDSFDYALEYDVRLHRVRLKATR